MKYDCDILKCACGCTTFTVARDGLIECSACYAPTANHMATKANVRAEIKSRRVKIIKPKKAAA